MTPANSSGTIELVRESHQTVRERTFKITLGSIEAFLVAVRANRWTGQIVINLSQGGITSVVQRETNHTRDGLAS
jgi:hypothetical protein